MQPRAFLLLAMLAPAAAAGQSASAAPRARTANGAVSGVVLENGVRAFRGIPFAAPPVRALRWRPPQPVRDWQGVRAADRFADQCMQGRPFSDMVFRNSGTSEDCLYLNVWTPAPSAGARLPVLVYFYGGGFIAGDGSEPRYDGASLARRGLVVVTVNYRLGIFGFFAHPELTRESPRHASGNWALLDQAAALRWVRANAGAFGGDPGRITIGGESAGSFSVSALMASPLTRDLIAGAIGESGAFFSTTLASPTLAQAEQDGVRFASAVGAGSLAALRGLSAMELLAASARPDLPRFGPIVDGWFFPAPARDLYAAGRQARVPLLAGWNSEEGNARSVMAEAPSPEALARTLEKAFGARAAEAAKVYPAATAEEALQSATDLASDGFIAYSTWKWLDVHAATSGRPVYRYLYAHPRPVAIPPAAETPRGAVHSAEIEYALGNLATNRVFAWTPDDYRVSETMQGYWANFVKTGDPNGPGLPAWPVGTVGPDGSALRLRIDVVPRAEPEPRARYLFLDSFVAQQGK